MISKRLVLYIHGKGGSAAEAEHYKPLFEGCEVVGLDYTAQTPWEAKAEFPALFDNINAGRSGAIIIANSIGAYFTLNSLGAKQISMALFISPVVDMEKLIFSMMEQAGVSEEDLCQKGIIPTASGEALSYDYLCYARNSPINWSIPSHILYGENDILTDKCTICEFADHINAKLTIMPNGEHWFHTNEQMAFLDEWIKRIGAIKST